MKNLRLAYKMTMSRTLDGSKYWANDDGQLNRIDGPAYEGTNGHKEWWVNGNRHRIDGPAIEYAGGRKEWFFNGKYIDCSSQEEFKKLIKLLSFL